MNKKLSYNRGTAKLIISVEILSTLHNSTKIISKYLLNATQGHRK